MPAIPLSLLVTHFIGDFLLQSDWMALNKSKWNTSLEGTNALTIHALVYSACFIWMGAEFTLITFVLHLFTDALTSKLTRKLWFFKPYGESNMWRYVEGKRHWFFVAIGFDQLLHYLGFWFTIWLLAL